MVGLLELLYVLFLNCMYWPIIPYADIHMPLLQFHIANPFLWACGHSWIKSIAYRLHANFLNIIVLFRFFFFFPECHSSCESCSSEGPLACTSCVAPGVLLPTGLCATRCPTGYFTDGERVCQGGFLRGVFVYFSASQMQLMADTDKSSCENIRSW